MYELAENVTFIVLVVVWLGASELILRNADHNVLAGKR